MIDLLLGVLPVQKLPRKHQDRQFLTWSKIKPNKVTIFYRNEKEAFFMSIDRAFQLGKALFADYLGVQD